MASRSIIAKCGHITRRLTRDEPLKGKVLAFALEVIAESNKDSSDHDFLEKLCDKLKSGSLLTDSEKSVIIDAILPGKTTAE